MTETLFDLDDTTPAAEPVDPKSLRELLFLELIATIEKDIDIHEADIDLVKVGWAAHPNHTHAWDRAQGMRSVLSTVRAALQNHEEYLVADRERSHAQPTETELECARHRDACPHCAADKQTAGRATREENRTKQLLDIYVGGLGRVSLAIATATENRTEIPMASIGREIRRVSDAAKRAHDRKEITR